MRSVLGYAERVAESGARNQLDMMMNRLRDMLDDAAPRRYASDWIQTLDGRRGFQLADPEVASLLGIVSRRARRERGSSMPPRRASGEVRIGERPEPPEESAPRPVARAGTKR
jgi:hypothetical protein